MRAFLFCLFALCIPAAYREIGKGFRLDKLVRCEQAHLSTDAGITHFYYMDQGSQSYVFTSEDGTYVLKLFRQEQSRNPLSQFVRVVLKNKSLRKDFEALKKRYFSACRIALALAPQETALIAAHLESGGVWPTARLHFPYWRTFDIPLDECCFVMQEKGERIFSALESADTEHMAKKLRSLRALLNSRASHGIVNLDSDLHRNFGFVGDRAIELDFGAYEISPSPDVPAEIGRFSRRIGSWLKKHRPEWVDYWERLE